MNWKTFVLATVIGSSLFAQFKVEEPIKGKLVLKDTENKEFEIKDDSKLEISVSAPTALDKLVLKNLYQVRIKSDNQEAIFEVAQRDNLTSTNLTTLGLIGEKKINLQDLSIICMTETSIKNESALSMETGSVACVKTKDCKAYVLGADKKFKLADTGVCIGKKEVKISKEVPTRIETITCRLFDEPKKENAKISGKFSFTREIPDTKEKLVRESASECK
tara:strand:+ start:27045 stop:27704 length:660 start_codon:yes stop_codon:yes gene_type:complete